jgi:uncharacterized membrane protein
MQRDVTVGLSVLAGVALFEAALIPGIAIGAAAVLAPKYVPKYLPKLRQSLWPSRPAAPPRQNLMKSSPPDRHLIKAPPAVPSDHDDIRQTQVNVIPKNSGLSVKRAIAKTVTFRIIVTSLDFSANYVVIGEIATAAGLSAFALFVGPFFYFVHEVAWNKYEPHEAARPLTIPLPNWPGAKTPASGQQGLTISRPLAKTITFRTFATTMDFTTNYVVVGDVLTAAALSAFGFALGPFIYLGHEMLWDHYGWLKDLGPEPAMPAAEAPR